MARHGLVGGALRSPLNPMWVLGQAPQQAGQGAMDMLPQAAKLGDAAVDAAAPAIGAIGENVGSGIGGGIGGALGGELLGDGAGAAAGTLTSTLAAIPGVGPELAAAAAPAAALGGKALGAFAGKALGGMIGKAAAPMAAKLGGRALSTGTAMGLRGVGDMMTGGPENPQAQRGQDFRTMSMMMPEMKNNPMSVLGRNPQPNVNPMLPGDAAPGADMLPWPPPTPTSPSPEPPPDGGFAPSPHPLEAPPVMRTDRAVAQSAPLPTMPDSLRRNDGKAFSIMADSSGAQLDALNAVAAKRAKFANGYPTKHQFSPNQSDPFNNSMGVTHDQPNSDVFTMRGPEFDVSGIPSISSAPPQPATPGGSGGGGGLLSSRQGDVINLLRRRPGSMTRPNNR